MLRATSHSSLTDPHVEPATAPPTEPRALPGHVALLVVQLCFGLFPMFGKLAFAGFSPRVVTGWRLLFGAVVLGSLCFALHGGGAIPRRGDLLRIQLCALIGIVLNQLLFLSGLHDSTAVNAGLLMALIPVCTFLIAACVRQEAFDPMRGLGILVAFAGAFWLLLHSGAHLHGNLLMVVNVVCYSVYLVVLRPLVRRNPPIVVTAWVFLLSTWCVPFVWWGEDIVPAAAGGEAWGSLVIILLFPTVLAYLLNLFALARVRASTVAVYIFLQPLIAGASGVLVLGEPLHGGVLLAALLILAGVALVLRRE